MSPTRAAWRPHHVAYCMLPCAVHSRSKPIPNHNSDLPPLSPPLDALIAILIQLLEIPPQLRVLGRWLRVSEMQGKSRERVLVELVHVRFQIA